MTLFQGNSSSGNTMESTPFPLTGDWGAKAALAKYAPSWGVDKMKV